MADHRNRTEIRERLLSQNPDRFAAALRDVMLHAQQEKLLTVRDAARVAAVAADSGPVETLVELVLALAEWP